MQSVTYNNFEQGWQYDMVRWYSTIRLNFWEEVWYTFFAMVRVWFVFFVIVRVRHIGTLFEFQIPDFLHIALAFCKQRQKTAETDVKCVN